MTEVFGASPVKPDTASSLYAERPAGCGGWWQQQQQSTYCVSRWVRPTVHPSLLLQQQNGTASTAEGALPTLQTSFVYIDTLDVEEFRNRKNLGIARCVRIWPLHLQHGWSWSLQRYLPDKCCELCSRWRLNVVMMKSMSWKILHTQTAIRLPNYVIRLQSSFQNVIIYICIETHMIISCSFTEWQQ